MQLLGNSSTLASWSVGISHEPDNHASIILTKASPSRRNKTIQQKQKAKISISRSNYLLLAICCCVITQLSSIQCKSTQLESEELHKISEKHQSSNLSEHDIAVVSSESEIKPKVGCVCNEILCVMSRHNSDDQRDSDPTDSGTQLTRLIEGARPPRQSSNNQANNGRAKYGLNSIEYRVADATNRFGLLFLNNLGTTKGNTIYSPVSLQAILNMLYLGAQSNSSTSRELSQGLGYDEFNLLGKEEPHQGLYNIYKDITDLLSSDNKDNVETKRQNDTSTIDTQEPSLSNRLKENVPTEEIPASAQLNFTMTNLLLTNKNLVDINEAYHSTLNKYYKVKLAQFKRVQATNLSSTTNTTNEHNLNLSSLDPVVLEVENEKQLADSINSWVSNNTNHKITKLVEDKDVPLNDLALALVNSAHFQASWLDKFDESQTREMYFYNEGRDDDKKMTPFMRKTNDFSYAQFVPKPNQDNTKGGTINSTLQQQQQGAIEAPDLDCQALEIPFSIGHGKELSMLILLPRQRQGLDKLQRSLTWSTLRGIYNALEEEKVQLELPKFTFEESYDVKKILERMGIRSVFDPSQASLTEMLVPKETKGVGNGITFSVDKILHKAKVEVHESGAEAAASTYAGVLLRASLYVRPTPKFIADHPFIFIIRHNKSNLPLFMGRVNQF